MAQIPSPSSASPPRPSAASAENNDPLASLHRMSTTAGVASQQYVAVNTAAVIALILGIASGLTMLSQMLLIVPLAGIICAVVAWRRIDDSNGTETGKPLAALGLLLSLLIGGGVLGKQLFATARARSDGRQMATVINQLRDHVNSERVADAYPLFSVPFRARVPLDVWLLRWKQIQAPDAYGKLLRMTWNAVPPQYDKTEGGDVTLGVIIVTVAFELTETRFTFTFRKVADAWQIEDIPEMFPRERPKPAK